MRGLFITFEGTEGAGKTTQIGMLASALQAGGHPVLVTREPGGTPFGVRLRSILLDPAGEPPGAYAEFFLYLADRAQHVGEIVAPALGRGTTVLCDRFTDATIAYQGYGRGLSVAFIREGNHHAAGGLAPDLTVLLDFERVEDGVRRARQRQAVDGTAGLEDRFEREQAAFHRRVQQGYRNLAAAEPGRFLVLPAERAPEDLHARIAADVAARLRTRGAATGE